MKTEDKTIGIITIQSMNYGNRLQNYALQKVLSEIGICKTFHISKKEIGIKARLKELAHCIRSKTRSDSFTKFNRLIHYETKGLHTDNKICEQYDYFVAGSDQIWNPLFNFNGEREFLTFTESRKKIAYAASIGLSVLPEKYIVPYKEWLSDFSSISMREEAGTQIVQSLTGRTDVTTVLDPTLLLNKQDWNKIRKKSQIQPKKMYIFKYVLGIDNAQIDDAIDKFASEHNMEIFELTDSSKGDNRPIGPAEFVDLIAESEFVFTDSFHATVFSLIYERPFYTIQRPSQVGYGDMSSRIDSLLSMVGLTNRIIKTKEDLYRISDECSFESIKKILEIERHKSMMFIGKSIK